MTASRFSPLFVAVLLGAACADRSPTAPLAEYSRINERGQDGRSEITVMAQNLYVGADVDLVIGALRTPDPEDDIAALFFAIETLGKTAFPARAELIADEIARERPHAVGLQEVSNIDIDLRPVGAPFVVHLDFLAILQDALTRRGLNYRLAAQVENIDAQLLGGLVRLVDHDALLVDGDRVRVDAAAGQNFGLNVGEVAPGIILKRGWVSARVSIGGAAYTLVSLHAEANLAGASLDGLRAAQLGEIVAAVAPDERVILMGDFNDAPGSLMYEVVTGAGFTDVWRALRPGVVGNTCCHAGDLSDPVADLSQRIDYVFARGLGDGLRNTLFGKIDRFGEVPADRVAGPAYRLWPSDHVGLVATLQRSNGGGRR